MKQEIASLVEARIIELKGSLKADDKEGQRTLAIWIRQYNKLARDAALAEMTSPATKDGTGKLIYVE